MGFEQRKELIRSYQDHWAEGDFSKPMPDGIEWGFSEDFPDAGTSVGDDEASSRMAGWLASWEDWRVEAVECLEAGDKIVVLTIYRGRGRGSGIEMERPGAHVWTFDGDRPTSMVVYAERDNALRDAGLG